MMFQPKTWREGEQYLADLRGANENDWGIMTPYEQARAERFMKAERERVGPLIEQHAIGELRGLFGQFQQAIEAIDQAKAMLDKWDAPKVQAELDISRAEIGRATTPAALGEVLSRAEKSGDRHRMKGAALAVAAEAVKKWPGGSAHALDADRARREAERVLAGLDSSPEVVKAQQDGHVLAEKVRTTVASMRSTAQQFSLRELGSEISRVRVKGLPYDGGMQIGWAVEILDEPSSTDPSGLGLIPSEGPPPGEGLPAAKPQRRGK